MKASMLAIGIFALGFTAGAAAQDTWLAPSETGPHGSAPGMKVQLLNDTAGQKTYAIIFHSGDDAFSGLYDFASRYHVTAAHFTAIGALSGARIAWFDPARKMYRENKIHEQIEVLSMVGDIALSNGKPAVHTHMVVGFPDGTTRGGHVLEADVRPTLEVMVTVEPNAMHRTPDSVSGLTLIDPSTTK